MTFDCGSFVPVAFGGPRRRLAETALCLKRPPHAAFLSSSNDLDQGPQISVGTKALKSIDAGGAGVALERLGRAEPFCKAPVAAYKRAQDEICELPPMLESVPYGESRLLSVTHPSPNLGLGHGFPSAIATYDIAKILSRGGDFLCAQQNSETAMAKERRMRSVPPLPKAATVVTRRQASAGLLAGAALAAAPPIAAAQAPGLLELPPPRSEGGLPLTQALKLRRSTREYSDRAIPLQVLADLLWSAFGVNRPASGDRTAPYWRHIMVIDIYAAMANGVWIYEPKSHKLMPHLKEDVRAQTGLQDFVAAAPLNLVYVAHGERMGDIPIEERRLYASVDTGFIGQNVYLFCASEGLATVFRGAVDYLKLARALRLPDQQFVTFAQTVGYAHA